MESIQTSIIKLQVTGKKKPSLTPRELIRYHIENPEEPITDEDIQNLNLENNIVYNIKSRDTDTEE